MGRLVPNALLVSAAIFLVVLGDRERPQLVVSPDAEVASLEAAAARDPSARALAALADAYLDRGQPGLAGSVLATASDLARSTPEVAFQEARALLGLGQARRAFEVASRAEAACDERTCPAYLGARIAQERAYLEALVTAGIEDPSDQPDRARQALASSRRAVQLVAVRDPTIREGRFP